MGGLNDRWDRWVAGAYARHDVPEELAKRDWQQELRGPVAICVLLAVALNELVLPNALPFVAELAFFVTFGFISASAYLLAKRWAARRRGSSNRPD